MHEKSYHQRIAQLEKKHQCAVRHIKSIGTGNAVEINTYYKPNCYLCADFYGSLGLYFFHCHANKYNTTAITMK